MALVWSHALSWTTGVDLGPLPKPLLKANPEQGNHASGNLGMEQTVKKCPSVHFKGYHAC